ncbi:MAG: ATP-binding cassette domain-containing protein [Paracoccaceae bacterium]|nr:ATP-binding cassette domain-containing protein [Paracoccaceae bacterium]
MHQLRLVHDSAGQGAATPPVAHLRLEGMRFGNRAVLGPLELSLAPSETLALSGPSGVGKTTLLRILAGLETGFRGTLQKPERVAVVFQEPTLMPWRSLRDNLVLTLGISADAAEKALDEVGLAGRGDDFPGQLSLGQQRRMALARAFASDPELLLMDEPFVSLDPKLADEMMTLFETLRAGRDITTLIVTHVESEARRLGTRWLELAGQPATLNDLTG